MRVHCPVDDPRGVRFDQVYDPGHPPVPRAILQSWPDVAFGLLALVTLAAAVLTFRPKHPSGALR